MKKTTASNNTKVGAREPDASEASSPQQRNPSKVEPLPGYRQTRPTAKNPWLGYLAFNGEGRAQCLLCGRLSTKNMARLRAHYFGGDRHVALCPSKLVALEAASVGSSVESQEDSRSSGSGASDLPESPVPTKQVKLSPEVDRAFVDEAVDAFAFSKMGSALLVTSVEFQTLVRRLSGVKDWSYE